MGRTCAACDEWRSNSHFSRNQWMKGLGCSRCKDCVNGSVPSVENNPSTSPRTPVPSRSHPHLQALDDLIASGTLTYDGWEDDVREAEDHHLNYPNLFGDYVEGMRLKQALHVGDRSHPQLQALDNMKRAGLTYIGWEADVLKAEDYHVRRPSLFDSYVEEMRRKQALYVGDRSHPQLQILDNMKREGLTYVGWQGDVRKAESRHVNNYPVLFYECVQEMRSKQTSYSSQQNARRLAAHESHHPRLPRESDRRIDDRQNQMAEIQESEECVVCWSSKRTHAFFPCGHMCVCNGCADTIQRGNSKCPLCRMVSRQIAKIYQ